MRRLVYSPKVNVYIKADTGIYDLSPYITNCTVDRKVNQVSNANVTFRNPDFIWTKNKYTDPITKEDVVGPVFHPMDPIIISMTRLRDRPIQVFTGFCDSTPYLTLFPGTVQLTSSCTLKRLLYTYWDPGLPFVQEWMAKHGWTETGGAFGAGGIINPSKTKSDPKKNSVSDAGLAKLLFEVLTEIGHWPEDAIFIEALPPDIVDLVTTLFDMEKQDSQQAQQQFQDLLHQIIGTSSLGGGGGPGTTGSGGGSCNIPPRTKCQPLDVGREMLSAGFKADVQTIAHGIAIVGCESAFGTASGWTAPQGDVGACGYWEFSSDTRAGLGISVDDSVDLTISTQAAKRLYDQRAWTPWDNYQATSSACPGYAHIDQYINTAKQAIKLGPCNSSNSKPSGRSGP